MWCRHMTCQAHRTLDCSAYTAQHAGREKTKQKHESTKEALDQVYNSNAVRKVLLRYNSTPSATSMTSPEEGKQHKNHNVQGGHATPRGAGRRTAHLPTGRRKTLSKVSAPPPAPPPPPGPLLPLPVKCLQHARCKNQESLPNQQSLLTFSGQR